MLFLSLQLNSYRNEFRIPEQLYVLVMKESTIGFFAKAFYENVRLIACFLRQVTRF